MHQPPAVCAVCQRSLDIRIDARGASYVHPPGAQQDHAPVPVPPAAGWRGHCDFCSEHPATHTLPVRDFTVALEHPLAKLTGTDWKSRGNWAACGVCAHLLENQEWDQLRERAINAFVSTYPGPVDTNLNRLMFGELFRVLQQKTTGPVRPVEDGDQS